MKVANALEYILEIIVGIMMMFLILLSGFTELTTVRATNYWEDQNKTITTIEESLQTLYDNWDEQVPRKDLNADEITHLRDLLAQITATTYTEKKALFEQHADELTRFIEVRDELNSLFENDIVKSTVELANVETLEQKFNELKTGSRKPYQATMDELRSQYGAMDTFKTRVKGLFTNETLQDVRVNLSRTEYKEVLALADNLKQRDVAESFAEPLKRVDEVLQERERAAAEARARELEAKRRAEELRRQREREVAAAWRALNVPYWSQNYAQIYNGCEAASLLMALQFKGYLQGVDLAQYAEMIPKSDNPLEGFTHSIYDFEPRDVPHWIAPAPLANFGRESSGGANVVDITGASLDDLDREVAAGNPVIIYITWLLKPVSYWVGSAPKNLHVVLLTGYNEVSGTQRLTDPWTQADGSQTWDVPRAEIEKIYNETGRRAVVVR